MGLMRWFRKYNRKILAVAVSGLLLVWLTGSALRMTCGYAGPRPSKALVFFGQKGKITHQDLAQADAELSILTQLRADVILHGGDIHRFFLAELIFSEGRTSPQLITALRQLIRNQQLRISDEQILGLYNKSQTNEIYWHLLKKEAEAVGVTITRNSVENVLRQIIPRLFDGRSYAEVINGLIQRGISEEQVLSAFGSLFSVIEYARIACSNEDLTSTEISQLVSDERQTLEAELVKFPAKIFADEQAQPTEGQIKEHFEKYKAYYPDQRTEENPYGFGYKLDDRVQLEYIVVRRDDVERIIAQPTQEEKEQYYLAHTSLFTERRRVDPNDPNSGLTEYTRTFGQVAGTITNLIVEERITGKAESLLARARQLAEANYGDTEPAELTGEQLKDLAVDFVEVASQVSKENPITVYSGKTALLRPDDLLKDKNLAGLFLKGRMAVPLVQLAFSVGQPTSADLSLAGAAQPRLYQTIGPLSDLGGKIHALTRVVDTQPTGEPAGLDVIFKPAPASLGNSEVPDTNGISVRQQVTEDLKTLAAMQTARQRSEEFLSVAQKDGWEKAIDQFNQRYPRTDPNEPNNFELTVWTDVSRPSAEAAEILAVQTRGLVGAYLYANKQNQDEMILEVLFRLVPPESNCPSQMPAVIEVRPDLGYYCIKNLLIKRIDRLQYDQAKGITTFRRDGLEAQSLGAVHFQPENILKRMNFRRAGKAQQRTEPNEPAATTEKTSRES